MKLVIRVANEYKSQYKSNRKLHCNNTGASLRWIEKKLTKQLRKAKTETLSSLQEYKVVQSLGKTLGKHSEHCCKFQQS